MSTSELADALAALANDGAAGIEIVAEPRAKTLLRAIGVRVPAGCVVADAEAAIAAAGEIGMPVAVKVAAPEIPHKSEVGGIRGPLWSDAEIGEAAAMLVSAFGAPLLVEEWVDGGVLCYTGLSFSAEYGAVVSFGLGGIWVEALRDVSHRLAPVSEDEAVEMALSLKAAPVLLGERGCTGIDIPSLAAAVARISRLALAPDIADVLRELDVNPLLARASGEPVALDCSLVLRPRSERAGRRTSAAITGEVVF